MLLRTQIEQRLDQKNLILTPEEFKALDDLIATFDATRLNVSVDPEVDVLTREAHRTLINTFVRAVENRVRATIQ